MAAEMITPVDEFSGLPLPLLPTAEVLPVNQGEIANWHHHFHPKSDPVLSGTIGGRALRAARIQLVPAVQHNYSDAAYHCFYAGPPIPTDRAEQFGMSVLACAGYMSDYAIDLADGEPQVRPMTAAQLNQLGMRPEVEVPEPGDVRRYQARLAPGVTTDEAKRLLLDKWEQQAEFSYRNLRYGYDPLRAFFAAVVLEQDVSHLPAKLLNKFMSTGDETEGMIVLAQAAVQAVETIYWRGQSVDRVYKQARGQGSLHPKMPPSASSLLKYKLGDPVTRRSMLPKLRSQLLGTDADEALAS